MNSKKNTYITPNCETTLINLEKSVFEPGDQSVGGGDYVKEEGLNETDMDASIWNEEEVEEE